MNYDSATLSFSSGIAKAHFQMILEGWIIVLDSTTWTNSNNIIFKYNGSSTSLGSSSQVTTSSICGSSNQIYIRFSLPYTHSDSSSIIFTLTTDSTDSNLRWGFKETILLAKACDISCTTCSGILNSQCTVCASSYILHLGTTCLSSCPVSYFNNTNVCTQCDVKCTACSTLIDLCSACTTSGTN